MASESQPKSTHSNIWPWALVVGLLSGFVIGREMGPRSGGKEAAEEAAPAAVAAAAPAPTPSKVYRSEAEFPAGWMKSTELTGVAGLNWEGLNPQQKTTAMQAMNERNCEC